MQERSAPHGKAALHGMLTAPRSWHICVLGTHSWLRPHTDVVHEVAAAGIAPQVPHALTLLSLQNDVEHWPANAQAPPLARGPTATQSAGGLLSRKSEHDSPAIATTHFSTSEGLLPVAGAANPMVQDSFSLAKHVLMSPHVRVIPRPFVHDIRLLQRACATSPQA